MAKAKKTDVKSPAPRIAKRKISTAIPAAPAAPVLKSASPAKSAPTREERHRMIAEAAYYIALRKGFRSDPRTNWMEAEAEIEARLKTERRA